MSTFDFDAVMSAWPEAAGAKPSQANVNAAARLVKRQGTAKHLAAAMYLRSAGATQPEVIVATGDTQINVHRESRAAKLAVDAATGKARGGHKVYRLALATPKAPRKASRKAAQPETAAAVTDEAATS